jgi:hypothetical protein
MTADYSPLEAIVAHGSRMSWAGLLRLGDEFAPARKSELAILTSESGEPLRRYFGKWSEPYRRFTTNLSSSKIIVKTPAPGESPPHGIQCVLHWVDRKDMMRSGPGSVCQGDGWPLEVWNSFMENAVKLPGFGTAEKLRTFLHSDIGRENEMVARWRSRVLNGEVLSASESDHSPVDESLLPVPAQLISENGRNDCIISWAPVGNFYRSVSEALASIEAASRRPDLINQAKYYLECTLSRLHGINFDSLGDFLLDEGYCKTKEVLDLEGSMKDLEQQQIRRLGKFC